MPGRDELIQQNIARAQAKSQAPQEQEDEGQTGSASPGGSAPYSFLGGNRDVYESLTKIEFQGIPGDGSMRGNTAYIRVWERAEVAEKTSNEASAPSFYDDEWAELTNNLWNTETPLEFSSEAAKNLTTYFDPDQLKDFSVPEFQVYPSGTFSISQELAFELETTQQNLSNTVPTTDSAESSQKATSATAPPSSTSEPPSTPPSDTMGSVQSANPGDQTAGGNNSSSATGKMMWQFLFNPSELELEIGPEFKNAETWGVSDKANSGQPLHWSHNKNALLKFNSVLLNGFVFGRKVESLEQGIIELFMSRDGDGQHGPHVLEFVWGKRVFGPCMIKNINIKEKMWDEGEVVNAELSFTLEQVPEWTINDGFVDVARPGRLDTEGDATKPGSSASNPAGNTDPNGGNSNPGGGSNPDQKSKSTSEGPSAQFCTQVTNAYSNFNNLAQKSGKSWTDNVFGTPEDRALQLGREYTTILNANKSILGQVGGVDDKCSKGCPQSSYYYQNTGTLNTNAYLGCIQSCSYQYASKLQGSYLDDKSCPKPQFVRPA